MRIGITGATGFVGSHLVKHLSLEGHTIIAYGRSKPPEQLLKFAEYHIWDLDFLPTEKCDVDVFIHSAGYVDTWGDYNNMYRGNVLGAKRVLEIAKGAKYFIYISSGSVYDPWHDKNLVDENLPYPKKYANNYGFTKSQAEIAVKKNSQNFNNTVILRPHLIYGPGDRHIMPRILHMAKKNRVFIVGEGKNKFSITHVGNICHAVSRILDTEKMGFKIYNVTDKETISIKNIFNKLFNQFNLRPGLFEIPYQVGYVIAFLLEQQAYVSNKKKTPLLTRDLLRQFSQQSTMSIDKISKDLGYKSPYNFTDGLRDLKIWIESIGGIEEYISNPNDKVWRGKTFSY